MIKIHRTPWLTFSSYAGGWWESAPHQHWLCDAIFRRLFNIRDANTSASRLRVCVKRGRGASDALRIWIGGGGCYIDTETPRGDAYYPLLDAPRKWLYRALGDDPGYGWVEQNVFDLEREPHERDDEPTG